MSNISVTISYGLKESVLHDAQDGATIDEVISSNELKDYLGFGESVKYIVDDNEQPGTYRLRDGDEVEIRTKSNSKA